MKVTTARGLSQKLTANLIFATAAITPTSDWFIKPLRKLASGMHIYTRPLRVMERRLNMQLQTQQDLENRISGGMEPRKPLTAKKRHDPGKTVLGILMMIVGVVSFLHFVPHPFNLIVAPVALILGASVASARQCGHCGARVDRDAAECPRCALPFSTR